MTHSIHCRSCGSPWCEPKHGGLSCCDCVDSTIATLPFTVACPSCRAEPGIRCATRLRRGYHLSRADRAVRTDNRKRKP